MKFRIFDQTQNRMIYAEEAVDMKIVLAIGLHGLPIVVDRDSFKRDEIAAWNVDHNRIPLQWTGFTDKKGVDIYAGDIVRSDPGDAAGAMENRVYEVYFDWGKFMLRNRDGKVPVWDVASSENEILGNIYMNQELLPEGETNK